MWLILTSFKRVSGVIIIPNVNFSDMEIYDITFDFSNLLHIQNTCWYIYTNIFVLTPNTSQWIQVFTLKPLINMCPATCPPQNHCCLSTHTWQHHPHTDYCNLTSPFLDMPSGPLKWHYAWPKWTASQAMNYRKTVKEEPQNTAFVSSDSACCPLSRNIVFKNCIEHCSYTDVVCTELQNALTNKQ